MGSVTRADGSGTVSARRRGMGGAKASEETFVVFFRQEYPAIERAVLMIVRDRGRAEDIAQDAFVQLFARWTKVERYERPGAWVRRVAIRMAVRTARREQRRAALERQRGEPVVDPIPDVDLAAAIRSLPVDQQAALVLFYMEDLPVADVAQILDRPEATVRSTLHRARTRLAEMLGHEGEDR
jgi:RNA polymerase sigma factor (sigma-70 family)